MHISGKDKREELKGKPKIVVPPFSRESLRPNTTVYPPPRVCPYVKRPIKQTLFSFYYYRGDLPFTLASTIGAEHGKPAIKDIEVRGKRSLIRWFCKPEDLDYCYYLPIFVEGCADMDYLMRKMAEVACFTLLNKGPEKILPVLPQLIMPLKNSLNTNIVYIMTLALKILRKITLSGPCVGQALVPYYRLLLPVCLLYRHVNVSMGGKIDTYRDTRMGDMCEDTLQILEKCGGPNAYINIKYIIPTYESCCLN